jgi:CMP-2-keto-3-deoxyoctulosonic acid synthetase
MIVAILIGREGSTGFPGKNVMDVLGKPLVAWPLEAAKAVSEIERIYVSTDSPLGIVLNQRAKRSPVRTGKKVESGIQQAVVIDDAKSCLDAPRQGNRKIRRAHL